MPTEDGLNPDQNLPLFLADEPAQRGTRKTWNRSVLSFAVLGAGVWLIAASALVVALLSAGVPARVSAYLTASIADVTASLTSKTSLQPGPDQSTPPAIQDTAIIQDTAVIRDTPDVQALPPRTSDAPAPEQVAAGPELAESRDSLISQFEAWAAEREARGKLEDAQPVQDRPASVRETPTRVAQEAEVAKDEPAARRPSQKRRHVRATREARAELRPAHDRRKVRRVAAPPADARAPEQVEPVQPPQPPSFLQSLGWSN